MHDPNDPYNDPYTPLTVTVDSPITITHQDDLYTDMLTSISVSQPDLCTTGTLSYDPLISSDTITLDNAVYVGNTKLDEQKIKLLDALIETINNLPEDNELRSLFENVQMINKMKNAD